MTHVAGKSRIAAALAEGWLLLESPGIMSRFDSPATTNAAYPQDFKDEFDVLHAEAASHRRMMSISTHDRISGIPGRVKLAEEFIQYAQKQKGVVFMRKDQSAKWALSAENVLPHKS